MKTSIKLCGFRNIDDIIFATSLDINYLGMIFVENLPRSIDIDTAIQAATICKEKNIKSVGVFLNQNTDTVDKILSKVDLDVLQLHGTEDITDYRIFKKDIIKTLHVSKDSVFMSKNLDFEKLMECCFKIDFQGEWPVARTSRKCRSVFQNQTFA